MTRAIVLRLAAACFAAPVASQTPAALTPASKYFVIELVRGKVADDYAMLLTNDAIAAADAAGTATEKLLQAKFAAKPKIVVYADEAAFRAVEKSAANEPCLVEAFCAPDGSVAHVLLRPMLGPKLRMVIGLPEPTRQSLMQCAARLLAASQSPTAVADPWLAEIVGFGVLENLTNPGGACGVEPHFDSRRVWHALTTRGHANMELKPRLIDLALPKDRSDYEIRIERSAVVAQLLAREGAGWARKLLVKPPKDLGVAANRLRVFEAAMGKDWNKTEAKWASLRSSMQPKYQPQNQVRSTPKGIELAGDETTAVLGSSTDMPGTACVIRGTAILTGDDAALRVELDWDGESLLAVWLEKGECSFSEWHKKGSWQQRSAKTKAAIPVGVPFDFRVTVDSEVAVAIDGLAVASTPRGSRQMKGLWQLAANETIATVRDVRLEPLPAAKK